MGSENGTKEMTREEFISDCIRRAQTEEGFRDQMIAETYAFTQEFGRAMSQVMTGGLGKRLGKMFGGE